MSNLASSFKETYNTSRDHNESVEKWNNRKKDDWNEIVKDKNHITNENDITIEINCEHEQFTTHIECDGWDFSRVKKFTIEKGKHISFKKCQFKEDVNLTLESEKITFEDCVLPENHNNNSQENRGIKIDLKGKKPELNIIGQTYNLEEVKIATSENAKRKYGDITIKSFQKSEIKKSKIKKLILNNIEVEKFICTGVDIDNLDLSESQFNIIKIANRSENNRIVTINLINTHFINYAKFDNIFTNVPDFSNIISTGADNIKIHKIDKIDKKAKCTANKDKQEEDQEKYIFKILKIAKFAANKDKQKEDPEKYIFLKNYYIKNNNYEEEMRFFRCELKAKNKDYLMRSYDFFSKCGTSIFRPFICLCLSFILFAFLNCYHLYGNICLEGFELSLARTIFPLFKTSIFGIEANFEKLPNILFLGQSFINIILIFLLFLAVRNKFKIK